MERTGDRARPILSGGDRAAAARRSRHRHLRLSWPVVYCFSSTPAGCRTASRWSMPWEKCPAPRRSSFRSTRRTHLLHRIMVNGDGQIIARSLRAPMARAGSSTAPVRSSPARGRRTSTWSRSRSARLPNRQLSGALKFIRTERSSPREPAAGIQMALEFTTSSSSTRSSTSRLILRRRPAADGGTTSLLRLQSTGRAGSSALPAEPRALHERRDPGSGFPREQPPQPPLSGSR